MAGGYLYLIDETVPMDSIEAAVEFQHSHDVDTRLIDPSEIAAISPMVDPGAYVAALWSPDDAKAEPEPATQGFARAARVEGAELHTGTAVLGIDVVDDEIRAVTTSAGSVATGTVVNCAGAWAPGVAQMVGWDLPIEPVRRQVVTTEDLPTVEPHETLTIDLATSFYFHQEKQKFTIGYSDPLETPGFKTEYDPTDWLPRMMERAERCAPGLLELGIQSAYAGLYAITPDHNQLIGEYTGAGRFFYAAGFSGHGFQMGPATGRIMSDLVQGRTPFIDVSSLAVERFETATGGAGEAFVV